MEVPSNVRAVMTEGDHARKLGQAALLEIPCDETCNWNCCCCFMNIAYYTEIGGSRNIVNVDVIKYLYFIYKDVTLTECPHQTAAKRQSSELSQCAKKHQCNIILLRTVPSLHCCGINMCNQRRMADTESALNLNLLWIMSF